MIKYTILLYSTVVITSVVLLMRLYLGRTAEILFRKEEDINGTPLASRDE